MTRARLLTVAALLAAAPLAAQGRPVTPSDFFRLRNVSDPQLSPDGAWVAFTVSQADSVKDKSDADIWMVRWDGTKSVRVTSSPDGERAPRWSPDGKYLAFISARGEEKSGAQIWLLDRAGGEAVKLTSLKGGVSTYEWSPDGTRIVVTSQDPAPEDSARKIKTPKPIVIDRYHFKEDGDGYLDRFYTHLWLVEVPTGKATQLTSGGYDETQPSWSPDGTRLVFTSKRTGDPDRNNNTDLYVVEAKAGAVSRQLTTNVGEDHDAAWSPDGRQIAYLSEGDPHFHFYNIPRLTLIPVEGGTARTLAGSLDRGVDAPVWTPDGAALLTTVTDDRTVYLARVEVAGGGVTRLLDGAKVVNDFTQAPDGRLAVSVTDPTCPPEVFALDKGSLRPLSRQNDEWIRSIRWGSTTGIAAKTKDGNDVHAVLVTPAGVAAGTRVPTVMRIHGGPVAQDQFAFSFERELFAAAGYAVVSPNYRGSSGRGEGYQRAISADWCGKEVVDLLAIADEVVRSGVADSTRLGIGGWSYGGILTDCTIATTTRFKAATSGAGSALQTSMYGMDQYVVQYETELGVPWKNKAKWDQVSYAFWQADRIRTPTLFLGGLLDFNVPIAGGEQMYQALRSQNVPTQLIIYPGQHHGISVPSYQVDRWNRYLAWYATYLMPKAP